MISTMPLHSVRRNKAASSSCLEHLMRLKWCHCLVVRENQSGGDIRKPFSPAESSQSPCRRRRGATRIPTKLGRISKLVARSVQLQLLEFRGMTHIESACVCRKKRKPLRVIMVFNGKSCFSIFRQPLSDYLSSIFNYAVLGTNKRPPDRRIAKSLKGLKCETFYIPSQTTNQPEKRVYKASHNSQQLNV